MLSRIRAFCSTSMTSLPIWWYLNPTNLRCALPFLFVRSDLLAPLSSGYPLLAAQQPMTYYPFWAGVRRRSWLGVGVRSYDYIYIWRLFMAYIWVFEAVYFFFLFFLVCNSFISFGCNLTSTIQGSGPLGHLFLPLHVAWLFPELFVLSLWKQKFSGVFILESHEFFQYVRWCEESSSYLVLLGEGFFHFILSLFYH